MSKNKHTKSHEYLREELQANYPCPRNNCRGTMVLVFTRYEDHGPLNKEFECTCCGKIKKDSYYADQRRAQYESRRKQNKNRK